VVEAVLGAIARVEGTRPAEAGEFTRRAFENGRLDLTVAEGLADLIDAETEAQRRQAVRQMGGALFETYESWRARLIEAMAYVEAGIDFADEELPEDVEATARPLVEALRAEIAAALADHHRGERIRDGVEIAILGAPNVGKSSLLNALARRDVAIVSDIAGTTRDLLEVHLDLGGYPVTVVDTAGLRTGGDVIEEEGIRRARARADRADLRLLMVDAGEWPEIPEMLRNYAGERSLIAVNKTDRQTIADKTGPDGVPIIAISAKTGAGIDDLITALGERAEALLGAGDPPVITRARHRRALEDGLGHLDRYLEGGQDIELAAEELRMAARALGRVTGRVDVEDILDLVFGSFCIGK
jgi:tRNA modification GTPase